MSLKSKLQLKAELGGILISENLSFDTLTKLAEVLDVSIFTESYEEMSGQELNLELVDIK